MAGDGVSLKKSQNQYDFELEVCAWMKLAFMPG